MKRIPDPALWPRKALSRLFLRPEPRTASLVAIRCNDKPVARQQGFGGQPIECFPVYTFFQLYLEEPEAGHAAFRDWYREWFVEREGWRQAKSVGGLANGSLQRAVEAAHLQRYGTLLATPGEADPTILREAINARVSHYFAVLESIRNNGFDVDRSPPITALQSGAIYYLRNGHHRCAALAALGFLSARLTVVNMLRFPRRPSTFLWKKLR